MKIQRIQITNFMQVPTADLDASNGLVLFGKNGAGKSSIINAIRMALFGVCEFTDGRGVGSKDLVRDGARCADIVLTTDAAVITLRIYRDKPAEWTATDPATGEMWESRDEFWVALGIDQRRARICAQPIAYLVSKETDAVLAEYAGGTITEADVLTRCGGHADWVAAFAQKKGIDFAAVADLTALGKAAYETRTTYNRDAAEARAELDTMPALAPPVDRAGKEIGIVDLNTIAGGVQSCVIKRDAYQRERGAAETALSPEARAALTLQRVEAVDAANHAAEVADNIAVALTDIEREAADLAHIQSRERDLNAQLAALESDGGCCPTCGHKYSVKDKAAKQTPIKAELEQISAEAAELSPGDIPTARAELDAARKRQQDAANALADIDRQLAAPAARPVADIDVDIAEMDGKIERGEAIVAALRQISQRAQLEHRVAFLDAEIAELSWAVKAFRDGDVTKQMIGGGLAEFEGVCNVALEPFGYVLKARASGKNIVVEVNGCPITRHSKGRRSLVAAVVAQAFADCGAPVLLDDLDALDGATRQRLLLERRESGVIAACAWQANTVDMAAVAGALAPLGVVWMENGTATTATAAGGKATS